MEYETFESKDLGTIQVIGPLIGREPALRGVWPWGLANQRQLANTGKNGLKRIPPV